MGPVGANPSPDNDKGRWPQRADQLTQQDDATVARLLHEAFYEQSQAEQQLNELAPRVTKWTEAKADAERRIALIGPVLKERL
jgi:hypothetical protein